MTSFAAETVRQIAADDGGVPKRMSAAVVTAKRDGIAEAFAGFDPIHQAEFLNSTGVMPMGIS